MDTTKPSGELLFHVLVLLDVPRQLGVGVRQPGKHRVHAGGFALRLKQLLRYRTAQHFLVEHLDLGTRRSFVDYGLHILDQGDEALVAHLDEAA